MFYNGVNCDIYIGKGAGKKLLDDMRNARKSIKIVSPYLSPSLVNELIFFRERNLEVELITSGDFGDLYGINEKNIHRLILQNRETDNVALVKRNKWKDISRVLIYIAVGMLTVLSGIAFYLKDVVVAFGLIPIAILFLVIKHYKYKIREKRIYSYWYSQLFPFKVYLNNYAGIRSTTFVHSKIYLFDDRIAYLGSLNFTNSGTKHNYETRIRTEDPNAIKEIKEEIHQLMNLSNIPKRDIQLWGRQLYIEPIN
jgi:phosphatidylserine/phosphatidylglycerophosphate/cardiolipin synthase-like enzyme